MLGDVFGRCDDSVDGVKGRAADDKDVAGWADEVGNTAVDVVKLLVVAGEEIVIEGKDLLTALRRGRSVSHRWSALKYSRD